MHDIIINSITLIFLSIAATLTITITSSTKYLAFGNIGATFATSATLTTTICIVYILRSITFIKNTMSFSTQVFLIIGSKTIKYTKQQLAGTCVSDWRNGAGSYLGSTRVPV
jgi:hypothetical protein